MFNTQFIFGLYLVWFHAFLFLFIKESVQLHYYIHIFYFVPLEKDLKTFCVATVKYCLCGSWARFLFSFEVVIRGNCNLVLYH